MTSARHVYNTCTSELSDAKMQLQNINKKRYRQHLNHVIIGSIILFATLSLGIAQFVIWQFTDGQGSHFEINLAGVILAMLIVGGLLNRFKHHPYMSEIYYVWRLKQQINRIIRKTKAINQAVERDDTIAIQVMDYFYKASRHLYELDDNTITLEEMSLKAAAIETKMRELGLESGADFQPDWLNRY